MVRCSILNCKSKSVKNGSVVFYTFPTNEEIANKWLSYCGPKTRARNGRICSNHFTQSDYIQSLKDILQNDTPNKLRQLKPDAVPSSINSSDKKLSMSEEITVEVDPLGMIRQMNSGKSVIENQTKQQSKEKRCKRANKHLELNTQAKMIVYKVGCFMKKEAEQGVSNIKQVQKRTAEATDTSVMTVKRIVKEGIDIMEKGNGDLLSEFKTPGKKRPRAKPMTDVDSFDQGVIKRCIHNFHITENVLPSIMKLRAKLANDIKYQGSDRSLSRIVTRSGFQWKRTEDNKRLLLEKSDIRFKRIEYLQKLRKYRQEGRPIVYTGESYVDSAHAIPKPNTNKSNNGPKKQTINKDKGQRINIIHAGSEAGFVTNALIMFQSETKNGDHHNKLTYECYKKWLRTQVIPNLPRNAVIVIDNASYHNKQYDPEPTSNARKSDMLAWLTERRIYHTNDMLKPQLYNLIKTHKKQDKIYSIDKFLAENNHEVLRLPPYHPDLNPIEMAWTAIRHHIVSECKPWSFEAAMDLIKEKADLIGPGEWNQMCQKVKEIEEEYRRSDYVVDMLTEKFTVRVEDDNSGSDAETQSVSGDDVSEDDEDINNDVVMATSSSSSYGENDIMRSLYPFQLYP